MAQNATGHISKCFQPTTSRYSRWDQTVIENVALESPILTYQKLITIICIGRQSVFKFVYQLVAYILIKTWLIPICFQHFGRLGCEDAAVRLPQKTTSQQTGISTTKPHCAWLIWFLTITFRVFPHHRKHFFRETIDHSYTTNKSTINYKLSRLLHITTYNHNNPPKIPVNDPANSKQLSSPQPPQPSQSPQPPPPPTNQHRYCTAPRIRAGLLGGSVWMADGAELLLISSVPRRKLVVGGGVGGFSFCMADDTWVCP